MTFKTCSKCGFVGLMELFRKVGQQCKKCEAAVKRESYLRNKDRWVKEAKARRGADPGFYKRRYWKNPEKQKASATASALRNSTRVKSYQKAYYEQNKDRWAKTPPEQSKAWKERNRERVKKYNAEKRGCLSPSYVASKLQMPVSEVTPELLELKRSVIQATRTIRAIAKEVKK